MVALFDVFKKGKKENSAEEVLLSPIKGQYVKLEDVPDPAFSSGALGSGIGINPEEGTVFAPASGTITTVFPTGHAVGLKTDSGVEVLIHIGLDTVNLKGEGFTTLVEQGATVKAGDKLVHFDIDTINQAGYPIITPVIVTNTDSFASVTDVASDNLNTDSPIIKIIK
ncbi:PTS glucose transporter subunit IIA [Aerococcaceae bacterium DSM 111020]|nr:PTS glucose transporter subunit IIA [Aerococcaceae bacterium DSM 111020]